jgi:serine protease Do
MSAGRTYVIDLESAQFDAYLRLEDPKGKVLAENDDISPDNQNSRIVFTAPADGTYRLVATSFQQRGTGSYTLTIRVLAGKAP